MSEVLTLQDAASLDAEEFRVQHLSDLLRSARSHAHPPMPRGPDAAGGSALSQEQAAFLLGISERHYREFERGRLVHPDLQFLDRVARVLRMGAAERKILHRLAVRDLPRPRPKADLDISGLQSTVDAVDFPAIVTDIAWNYVAWNRAVADYLLDPADMPKDARNAILLGFGPVGAARWPSELPHLRDLVGRARAAYIAEGGRNPTLQDFIEQLVAIPAAAAH